MTSSRPARPVASNWDRSVSVWDPVNQVPLTPPVGALRVIAPLSVNCTR